jgi:hypothetical protein
LIEIVLRSDRAAILRFWLQMKLATPQELLTKAVNFDAFHCFHVLARDPEAHVGSSLAMFLRTASVPPRVECVVGRREPVFVYTYRTPSELIDLDQASLVFLLYRRIMRLVTMGRLRR